MTTPIHNKYSVLLAGLLVGILLTAILSPSSYVHAAPDEQSTALQTQTASSSTGSATSTTPTPDIHTILATSTASSSRSNETSVVSSSTPDNIQVLEDSASFTPVVATSSTSTDLESIDSNNQSTTTITTGKAVATANVVNIVNTSTVNSDGTIIMANLTDNKTGTIDLRTPASSSESCTVANCATDQLTTVTVNNTADIKNTLVLEAQSGNNQIESDGGHANITSGDALVGLNLVTVANTSLVDSKYLLVSLNAFGDVVGDIVFPSLNSSLHMARSTAPTTTANNATATVQTSISSNATSGNNGTDAPETTTTSGNAWSMANVVNTINTSLIGGNSVSIVLKVHGAWLGEFTGLIPGIKVHDTGNGYYQLTNETERTASSSPHTVTASTSTHINNSATLTANSGSNTIFGADSSDISSGRALIGANVINIANATVIGRNWTLAIINIFGNFTGNLAFGRPDLWVGESIAVPTHIQNGSVLDYSFLIKNNGDAAATNVMVRDQYATNYLTVMDASHSYAVSDEGELTWEIAALEAGESVEITYQAQVQNTTPGTEIINTVRVSSRETDNNLSDNTDTASVITSSPTRRRNRIETADTPLTANDPEPLLESIEVERLAATTRVIGVGETVTQTLTIRNPHNTSLPNVTIADSLASPAGAVVKKEIFDLGTLLPYEEIVLQYNITFLEDATQGIYVLSTTLTQDEEEAHTHPNNGTISYTHPKPIITPAIEATNSLPLLSASSSEPQVLGTNTTTDSDVPAEIRTDSASPMSSLLAFPTAYGAGSESEGNTNTPYSQSSTLPYLVLIFAAVGAVILQRYLKS